MKKNNLPQTINFDKLLQLEKVEPHHIESLSREKQLEFRKHLSEKLAVLKDEARDTFLKKIEALIEPDKIWEFNHISITSAIHDHLVEHGLMPSKILLAQVTGLSRQTIYRHLQTFTANPAYAQRNEEFSLMTHQVLSIVLQRALKGDIAAAKLYLQAGNKQPTPETSDIVINNQHNYIQINGTVLNQQTLQLLKPEQLNQIEAIIKSTTKS